MVSPRDGDQARSCGDELGRMSGSSTVIKQNFSTIPEWFSSKTDNTPTAFFPAELTRDEDTDTNR